ncbi:TAXI family TRAP transporter solute-binding subunit [Desulfosediminicola flagellatus]|uniref:TAXI family TRAP transporter solute-binding subunit n=1 Tax=Desulfosediminicola flagellatus TaxID=2569541 RepID=UPI0010ABB0EE|nr:TAXI family TRAP transporter solute-binding subunit [Desulfosediminicola flagellatus]
MKRMLVAVMVLLVAGAAMAEGPVITTGSKTGSYVKVGHNLKNMLGTGEVITSKGSVENLERLMKGEAQIGLVQMDAFAWYALKHPEVSTELEIIGGLYEECAYLAVRKEGKVQSEDDLQSVKDATIAVGSKGSGTAVTWDYMLKLEPKYKNSRVEFTGGSRALSKLIAKQVDAVMWVTQPNLDGQMAKTVLKNEDLELVGFNDKDLNDKLPSTGKPVYQFRKIDTQKGFFNDKEITTACVEAVIVARKDTNEDILESVSDALLNYKQTLLK